MKEFDLVIFDCDGTLVDSDVPLNTAFIDLIAEDGFTGYESEDGFVRYDMDHARNYWVGTNLASIMEAIETQTKRKLPEATPELLIARYAEYIKTGLKEMAGASEAVSKIKQHYNICVATNGQRENVISSLQSTNLLQFFSQSSVYHKGHVQNLKPAPDIFLYAAKQFNVAAERCVVIEDSKSGVLGGVAAGMTVYGVTAVAEDQEEHAAKLRSAGAHEVFPSLIHIAKRLGL